MLKKPLVISKEDLKAELKFYFDRSRNNLRDLKTLREFPLLLLGVTAEMNFVHIQILTCLFCIV